MLVGKNWKMTSMVLDPGYNINGVTVTDYFAQLPACLKDGTTKFVATGTYADDEGPSKCSSSDPQTIQGTWVFNPSETVLTMKDEGEPSESYDLVTLTSSSLVIAITDDEWDDGLVRKITMGFTAQ